MRVLNNSNATMYILYRYFALKYLPLEMQLCMSNLSVRKNVLKNDIYILSQKRNFSNKNPVFRYKL